MAKKIKLNIFDDMKAAPKDAAAYVRGEAQLFPNVPKLEGSQNTT